MTKTTNFVWDAVSDCVISELDGTNDVQAVYTNEPQQYGGVISQRRGSTRSTLHVDALGTTRLLTDSTQATTDTYLFDAWGHLIASIGTTINPFRWVGRYGYYQDAATGMVYVRARMYVPTVGRWASLDPFLLLSEVESPPDALYSLNAPIHLLDPAGLIAVDRVIGLDVLGNSLGCKAPPAQAAWMFKSSLLTGWPCDGKLIQLVKIVCQVSPYCRDDRVRVTRRAYVEGWDVTKGKHVVDANENAAFSYTDMARLGPPRMDSWGNYTQVSSIRLFCYAENRDGTTNDPSMSRVTLRDFLKAPVNALADDEFCATSSGVLKGRTIGWNFVPEWWERFEAREGIGHRTFGVYWDCCCEPFDHEAEASEVGMASGLFAELTRWRSE